MEEVKKPLGTWQYILFIAIPVILVLVVLGFYFKKTQPIDIFKNTIETASKEVTKLLDKYETQIENTEDRPFEFQANASLDMGFEYQEFNSYSLNLNGIVDMKNQYVELDALLNENDISILSGEFILNENIYATSKELINYYVNLGGINFDDYLPVETTEELTINDLKIIIEELSSIINSIVKKEDFTKTKETLKINNKDVTTTKITFTLNEDNYVERGTYFFNQILENDKLISTLTKISGITTNEIKTKLEDQKNNLEFDGKPQNLHIYTTNLGTKVVKVSYDDGHDSLFDYTIDNGIHIIEIYEKKSLIVSLEINVSDDKVIEAEMTIHDDDTYTIGFKLETLESTKTSGSYKLKINATISGMEFTVNASISYKYIDSVEKKKVSESVNYEEISEEEIENIIYKLYEILLGYNFDDYLNDYTDFNI